MKQYLRCMKLSLNSSRIYSFKIKNFSIHRTNNLNGNEKENENSIFHILNKASDLLPHQAIIENFVHHNPLEDFEHLKWYDAIDQIEKKESYISPGQRLFELSLHDPRIRVNNALVDLSAPFLDRGISKWSPRYRHKGFLYFFSVHENLGIAKWREGARKKAKEIFPLLDENFCSPEELSLKIIEENLIYLGIPKDEYEDCIRSMLLELKGWAGMFKRMEHHPNECPQNVHVTLLEFCAVQTIFTRSSMDAIVKQTKIPISLSDYIKKAEKFKKNPHMNLTHPSSIAYIAQNTENREALETEYEKSLLHVIDKHAMEVENESTKPFFQLYKCIDDRECSLRRYVEEHPDTETYCVAGFFGLPIKFNPADGGEQMILAPEGQNPTEVVIERPKLIDKIFKRRKLEAKFEILWENFSFSPIGSLLLSCAFPITYTRLFLVGLFPEIKYNISEQFRKFYIPNIETQFKNPFTTLQAASLLSKTFKNIGNHKRFADIVIILGHGAQSSNNPFFAAYNCGACGGRDGGPNARLLALLANDIEVRKCLKNEFNIEIPEKTFFIGGDHITTNDTVKFYDSNSLTEEQNQILLKAKSIINDALGKSALERCSKFLRAKNITTPEKALKHVHIRSVDAGEVRPELNHSTNAGVIVGRRKLSKGIFLDRRVFMPSYDPFSDDNEGTNLEQVLKPALIVCSGINLEYLFSTIGGDYYGAGTKAPLNIVGNIGVTQGTMGDLRTGLPSQMTEMHTPIRAIFIIDSPIDRFEKVLKRNERLLNLVRNEWVRVFVRDPVSNVIYKQKDGNYNAIEINHNNVKDHIPFNDHWSYGMDIYKKENAVYWISTIGSLASCLIPMYLFSSLSMNPFAHLISIGGTLLTLPILGFSRRYLHGEFLYTRINLLSTCLLAGFNIVALAPNLHVLMFGWGIFGFASTFLIGSYNDRPTVRNNAIYAFGVYRISDFAMMFAAAFSHFHNPIEQSYVAASLIIAAIFKSSQFPLTVLFVRSMEGPTPCSAIGYTGLSAHAGIILLSSTINFWYPIEWARHTLIFIGSLTAIKACLKSQIRAERKGSLANATSGTIGLIYIILALGHADIALLASFGHASFRMIQILRSPNKLADTQRLKASLGYVPWPKVVSDSVYKFCWVLKRIGTDLHLFNMVNRITKIVWISKGEQLTKKQRYLITSICLLLSGIPSPISHFMEEYLVDIIPKHPILALSIMFTQFISSIILIRFLFNVVLNPFKKTSIFKKATSSFKENQIKNK